MSIICIVFSKIPKIIGNCLHAGFSMSFSREAAYYAVVHWAPSFLTLSTRFISFLQSSARISISASLTGIEDSSFVLSLIMLTLDLTDSIDFRPSGSEYLSSLVIDCSSLVLTAI